MHKSSLPEGVLYTEKQMKKTLRILRRASKDSEPYWQEFEYETADGSATVATTLMTLPVTWEHSCLQKKCGACAMVINKVPRLACDTRLADLKGDSVTVEPLRKFPVIEDLLVDRKDMMDRLEELKIWFADDADVSRGREMAFEASKCLQCGLCLEVCQNFHTEGKFGGMAAMAPLARLISKMPDAQVKELRRSYKKAVYDGCGKSLACRDICPAGINIEDLLVRSNAAAIWKRRLRDEEE